MTLKDLEDYSTLLELRENPVYAAQCLLNREYDPVQAIGIWGSWNTPYSMIDAGRGTGKLCHNDVKIISSLGIKKIGDLVPKNIKESNILSVVPCKENISVSTPEGMRSVKNWMATEKVKTKKFTTKKGYFFEVCTSQPILICRNGQIGWESSGDLKLGDYLVLDRKYKDWNYIDNNLDPSIAMILGMMVGDGSYNLSANYCIADIELKNIFYDVMQDKFNYFVKWKEVLVKNIIYKTSINIETRKKLYELGLNYVTGADKSTPNSIWSASRECQAAYLSGLFNTDGTADTKGYVSYCTISKQLAQEIQFLLLTFGIISKLRSKETFYKDKQGKRVPCQDAYMVDITGVKNCNLFYDQIGFSIERKQVRRGLLKDVTNSNDDVIPGLESCFKVLNSLLPIAKYAGGPNKERALLKDTISGKYECTYEKLPRIIELYKDIDHPAVQYLRDLMEWNFYFDPIISIEEGFDFMYDLEIIPEPGDKLQHAFIANGIVTHNCVSSETMVKLDDGSEVPIKNLYDAQSHYISYDKKEWWAILDQPITVKSYDPVLRKIVSKPVITIFRQKIDEELLKITTDKKHEIICTKIHKLMNNKNEWVKSADIAYGDKIVVTSENGRPGLAKVVEIEAIAPKTRYVYDLSVEDTHNFIANGIVAHNTALAADLEVLSSLLYPGTTSLIISYNMKSAKLVFDELQKTWNRSRVVKDSCEKRPTKGNDMCEMKFLSSNPSTGQQTTIKAIATDINNDGAAIRGNRVSRMLHIDEWIYIPMSLIFGAAFPCASTTDDPTRPQYDLKLSRFLLTCSSGYTYMEAYKTMSDWRNMFLYPEKYPDALTEDGKPKYFYHHMNYLKITKPGILNYENIKMWKATFPVPKFNTEVLAQWESESGSWYNSKDIKGDPEDLSGKTRGIWISSVEDPHAEYKEVDKDTDSVYVLCIDPAEQQDETGATVLKVTKDKIYISETNGHEGTTMPEVAEIIRCYMDRYNVVSIAMDPEGGGRAGVVPELKKTTIRHNSVTGKLEAFFPIFPKQDKYLKKNEEMPAGTRRLLYLYVFSSNANEANLTDLNSTLRTMIKSKNLLVANDGPEDFTYRVNILLDQIVAIEATAISSIKGATREQTKQAADKGRFTFTSRILKDRWASLLIGVWHAIILQAEMNLPEEESEAEIAIIPNIYDQWGSDQHYLF